ncbi:unnamed protein product [Peniophora sp. CBMAI 1063]|nr:unnamed protein product [Peniophora sp. CBMAI 1063]
MPSAGTLIGLKVANIDQIVKTYGPQALDAFRKETLAKTTDPLAPSHQWTTRNWPTWLVPEDYVVFLAKRLQVLQYGIQAFGIDAQMDAIGVVVQCVPFREVLRGGRALKDVEKDDVEDVDVEENVQRDGCAWRECEFHGVKGVGPKLMGCKGCGEVRYCGRECQRRDWRAGGHKTRCGTRLKRPTFGTSSSAESALGSDIEIKVNG